MNDTSAHRPMFHGQALLVEDEPLVLSSWMSGPQLVTLLRSQYGEIPTLFISGNPNGQLDARMLDERTRLLMKPFAAGELSAALRQLLGSAEDEGKNDEERLTLLVVEDEEASRRGLARLLVAQNHDVLTAASFTEARRLAASRKIDVLLTDLWLRSDRGDVLAEEIRQAQPDVAVVYVSGVPSAPMRVPGTYLEKPVDAVRLEQILERLHDRRHELPVVVAKRRPEIVVRRRQANGAMSHFAVRSDSAERMRSQLSALLEIAARERGVGIWSEANPEVWIDGKLAATLTPERTVAGALEQVTA